MHAAWRHGVLPLTEGQFCLSTSKIWRGRWDGGSLSPLITSEFWFEKRAKDSFRLMESVRRTGKLISDNFPNAYVNEVANPMRSLTEGPYSVIQNICESILWSSVCLLYSVVLHTPPPFFTHHPSSLTTPLLRALIHPHGHVNNGENTIMNLKIESFLHNEDVGTRTNNKMTVKKEETRLHKHY